MNDDSRARHDLKNHLTVIAGFAELLLAETEPTDPRRADFVEIQRAAQAALSLLATPTSGNWGGPGPQPNRRSEP